MIKIEHKFQACDLEFTENSLTVFPNPLQLGFGLVQFVPSEANGDETGRLLNEMVINGQCKTLAGPT